MYVNVLSDWNVYQLTMRGFANIDTILSAATESATVQKQTI